MLLCKKWSWSILFICAIRLCVWTPFAALLLPAQLTQQFYTKDSAFSFGCEVIRHPFLDCQELLGFTQELKKFIIFEQEREVELRSLADQCVRKPLPTKPLSIVFLPDSSPRQSISDSDAAHL